MGSRISLWIKPMQPGYAPGARGLVAIRICFWWTSSALQSSITTTSRIYWVPRRCSTRMKFWLRGIKWHWGWCRNLLPATTFSCSSSRSLSWRWEIYLHSQVRGVKFGRTAELSILRIRLELSQRSNKTCVFLFIFQLHSAFDGVYLNSLLQREASLLLLVMYNVCVPLLE